MSKKLFKRIGLVLKLAMALMLAPIAIPFGLLQLSVMRRRMRKDVKNFSCVVCRCKLTRASLHAADTYWACHVDEMQHYFAGERLRLVRAVDAVCTTCITHYLYQAKERSFVRTVSLQSPYSMENAMSSPNSATDAPLFPKQQ
jgi:hypothetical protein